jgi:hypothetical protein
MAKTNKGGKKKEFINAETVAKFEEDYGIPAAIIKQRVDSLAEKFNDEEFSALLKVINNPGPTIEKANALKLLSESKSNLDNSVSEYKAQKLKEETNSPARRLNEASMLKRQQEERNAAEASLIPEGKLYPSDGKATIPEGKAYEPELDSNGNIVPPAKTDYESNPDSIPEGKLYQPNGNQMGVPEGKAYDPNGNPVGIPEGGANNGKFYNPQTGLPYKPKKPQTQKEWYDDAMAKLEAKTAAELTAKNKKVDNSDGFGFLKPEKKAKKENTPVAAEDVNTIPGVTDVLDGFDEPNGDDPTIPFAIGYDENGTSNEVSGDAEQREKDLEAQKINNSRVNNGLVPFTEEQTDVAVNKSIDAKKAKKTGTIPKDGSKSYTADVTGENREPYTDPVTLDATIDGKPAAKSKAEKAKEFLALLENPEVDDEFKRAIGASDAINAVTSGKEIYDIYKTKQRYKEKEFDPLTMNKDLQFTEADVDYDGMRISNKNEIQSASDRILKQARERGTDDIAQIGLSAQELNSISSANVKYDVLEAGQAVENNKGRDAVQNQISALKNQEKAFNSNAYANFDQNKENSLMSLMGAENQALGGLGNKMITSLNSRTAYSQGKQKSKSEVLSELAKSGDIRKSQILKTEED